MRKITGYIGALIVVVALMGSILAGYALNINGQSVVVNEYENVTDVSGLYSHTDQKTYIDYNPASNYIGYSVPQSGSFTINNPNGANNNLKYEVYTTAHTGEWNTSEHFDGAFYNDGTIVSYSTSGAQIGLTHYRIILGETFNAYSYQPDGSSPTIQIRTYTSTGTLDGTYNSTSIIFNFDGSTMRMTFNGITIAKSTSWVLMPSNTGDYVTVNNGTGYYQMGEMYKSQVYADPSIRINEWNNQPTYDFYSVTNDTTNSAFFVPAVFTYEPVDMGDGIDYTESNRVNNYIVGYENGEGTPVTTTSRIDLQNISTTNYATPNKDWIIANTYAGSQPWTNQLKTGPIYTDNDGYQRTGGYIVYKMSDVLTSIGGLGENTKTVTFSVPVVVGQFSDGSNAVRYTVDNSQHFWTVPYNFVVIGNQPGTYDYDMYQPEQNPSAWTNLYRTAVYDVETGLVNIYDVNGAKILTDNISNIYIQSISNPGSYGLNEYHYTDSVQQGVGHYYMQRVPVTVLDITVTTSTSTSTPIYMDITKGVKLDSENVAADITWNNEYENGQIQLLFRAEDTYSTYHNEMSISGNSISVDYTSGRFFISLNSEEPIDVGAWRSIILDIDLLNGDVSVNPVRTFNSYTNVSTDKAVITIGDMVNPAPTTTITWKPTPNSFTFSVYRTDVFLNTYGVVMVNPSLNITNYFTDLNNFYRLVLDNFSTYGDSITVNGITGDVSGNTVTFNDVTLTMKDLDIIYADGHAYIEDGQESIDLGTIVTNDISLSGVWYFETDLDRGYTALKQIYTWDWTDFILDNTQFCIFYIGLALVGLIVARRFCIMSVIDYAVFITSIIIALSTQVIA